MNITHLQHTLIALIMQGVIALLTGNWWAGAALGAAFFLGREHTQAEYKWIEKYGNGKRINLPWWGGFDYRVWAQDSLLDCLCPTVAVLVVAWIA